MGQELINGLNQGLLLALVALGFQIIFSTTKIFHMAHAGVYVTGAYFFYWINPFVGVFLGVLLTLIFSYLVGIFIGWAIYNPLIKFNNESIILVSSIGVYIIIVNIISLLFGSETKVFPSQFFESTKFRDMTITHSQIREILYAIPTLALFIISISISGLWLKIKAIENNTILAKILGLKISKIRYLVLGLGSAITVVASILQGYDTGINPNAGMSITLSAVVVVILSGGYSLNGTLVVSLLLSIIRAFTEHFLSSQWKDPVTFSILIGVLLWRTEGVLQFNIRNDEK